ncbi:diacylglycerol O-acyltransferase 1-2-like isoform X2 [Papaver somniferum]|uniref:diacylglycerol O-acyltransferase 1-2-like isoform X2 n=1 Tax=Papaver somniferum TaxID=3469 RepID=UPI000E6FA9FF|nr:diacylglycerol O-acyltransferase 1-2-like isoform X2 [Papaver somniferum]
MFRLDVILQLRIVDLGLMLKLFLTRASAPAHRRVKESHLSSDAIFRQSHAGLFNLCIGVLVAVKISLITENLMKLYITKRLTTFHVLVEKIAQNKLVSEPD